METLGFQGWVTVQDGTYSYATPEGFVSRDVLVPLRAHVCFPADPDNPDNINPSHPFPLIVIVHGNGHNYATYDFLLEHFAKNGFIAASIHLTGGMRAHGRANVLFEHLLVLTAKFGSALQSNIGLMGHSRGGEAIIKAVRLNQQLTFGYNFNALISLAPTDQYGKEELSGAWATPYLVVYGSRDGDIDGGIWTTGYTVPQTGFALYDRARGAQTSMVFVYRATHNGFITTNYDAEIGDQPDVIDSVVQQKITLAYMNAFFRQHLMNEPKWNGMFTGEWKPASVNETDVNFYVQFQDPTHRKVDNFDSGVVDWQSSTIGGAVTHNMTLPEDPEEGKMHNHSTAPGLDPRSPHDTKGLRIHWDNLNDILEFEIPPGNRNVSMYSTLSFRITQKVDSQYNTVNQGQNLRISLRDSAGNERAVRVSAFYEIPFPDHRANDTLTKSAMNTIRIPLTSYTIVCAGQPQVNLQNIEKLSFVFSEKTTGEVEIDDIEFTL
jgi:hypothetical protein